MDAVPVVATADEHLREDAVRWCAALGATPDVVADLPGLRRAWRGAALVVLGADLAPQVPGAGLPRRDHVLLVDDGSGVHDPWPAAVAVGAVDVVSTTQEERALQALTLALDGRREGCLVSVVGAVGGAGASTFAAALGHRALTHELEPMLLDLDALGGGLDLVLGAERTEGVRWQGLGGTGGTLSASSLAEVLPRADGLAALTWSRADSSAEPTALPAVLDAASRGFDLVVADVPRHALCTTEPGMAERDGTGVGTMGMSSGGWGSMQEVVGRSVCTVVLVPEETRALGAARALMERLGGLTAQVAVLAVARPGGLDADLVQRTVGRPVLGRLRADRRLRAAVEQGHGPRRSRTLGRAADQVLDLLGLTAAA
ncbi:septum site-determining protein Ssd [Aeromicrobium sp. CTD01-1L150]|uniref:septum site-determining protein Ssd n=1 Tax=Aeromicrobium sp. CTD01-1L150 TaxID=3341830 RepID=UPI0035C1125B